MAPDLSALVAAILNEAWMVRHYARPVERLKRRQAIQKLGLTVRHAFNTSEDFEALLGAIVDGLRPRGDRSF